MTLRDPERVLITGASGGIGAAFARALPSATDLVLVGRDVERMDALAADLDRPDRRVEVVTADLRADAGVEAVAAAAIAGPIDGLINNAGAAPHGPVLEADPDALVDTVDVNCRATLALTRALLPSLLDHASAKRRRAFLVNVASTTAYAAVPRLAVYAASKAFVLSFTEALATELRREPIDVLALCPGPTRTSSLPFRVQLGARSPDEVARTALEAVGRTTVAYTDMPTRLMLGPVAQARAALSRGLDAALAMTLRS